jgi:hypothetical protein
MHADARAGPQHQHDADGLAGRQRRQEPHPGIGSAVTYLRRYTLLAITGVAVESEGDDDGAGGISGDERAQLRELAHDVRQGRGQRQSPHQVRGQQDAPPEALLEQARKAADKGHKHFGTYWRDLAEDKRGLLMPEMNNLVERANAASAQLAQQDGGK